MKSAVFDIETSALEGIGAGILLCVCIRPVSTQRTRTFRLDEYEFEPSDEFGFFDRQENAMLKQVMEELSKYDLLIGHYIDRFDLSFLKTRATRHQVPFNLMPITYDTKKAFSRINLRTVLNGFGKPSGSMDMIADLLGIKQEKTKIYPVKHWQTLWGNKAERIAAMDDLVYHCQRDVRMNAQIYDMFLPLDYRVTLKRYI